MKATKLLLVRTFIRKLFNLPTALSVRLSPAVNRLLLCCSGAKIGRNVCVLGRPYLAVGGGSLTIGDDFYMTNGGGVNPLSGNQCGVFFTEPGATITIGNHVGMSGTRMWIKKSLQIGNNVNIGANVMIIDTDCHPLDYRMRRADASKVFSEEQLRNGTKVSPVVIEDDVWIGANVIVLKGVTIGARSIVGAGSIVTHDIPADSIVGGNPARVLSGQSDK